MSCTCNCHDPNFRRDTNTPEHADCDECRKALEEEEAWFKEIEIWHDNFEASGDQRPFRSVK